jgi:hypothetical protein
MAKKSRRGCVAAHGAEGNDSSAIATPSNGLSQRNTSK